MYLNAVRIEDGIYHNFGEALKYSHYEKNQNLMKNDLYSSYQILRCSFFSTSDLKKNQIARLSQIVRHNIKIISWEVTLVSDGKYIFKFLVHWNNQFYWKFLLANNNIFSDLKNGNLILLVKKLEHCCVNLKSRSQISIQ